MALTKEQAERIYKMARDMAIHWNTEKNQENVEALVKYLESLCGETQ